MKNLCSGALSSSSIKSENGITLIALIITIIILVILAAVSIRAAYNSGIIDYSINGTKKYAEEGKKEESTLKNAQEIMKSALGKLNETGNSDVPNLLRKYDLGADGNGKDLYDILYFDWDVDGAFINDPNSITDAHDTVIYLNDLRGDYKEPNQQGYFYIKYNNVYHKY